MRSESSTAKSIGDGRRIPRQDRAIASRAKMLAGAKNLLSKRGISAFSMRKLAAASGVGLGTIYDYFPSWTDIVRVLLEERFTLRCKLLDKTLSEVPVEQGLAVFVPAYLDRLTKQGFWQPYDVHLREAAATAPELNALFEKQQNELADRYVAEMKRAGSQWPDPDLLQIMRANIEISQHLLGSNGGSHGEGALTLRLVTNMLIANLKMALRPPDKSNSH